MRWRVQCWPNFHPNDYFSTFQPKLWMKLFAVGRKRKVHCYVAAEEIQILLCGSLIPILLSFLMTINEDIYSAQFGCRPQNVQVCPSATFIGVDISRCSCTDLPSNVTTSSNTQIPQIGQITKYQNYQNSNVTFYRDHQLPSLRVPQKKCWWWQWRVLLSPHQG